MINRNIDLNTSGKELMELEEQLAERKIELKKELASVERDLLLVRKELNRREAKEASLAKRSTAYSH